jgi:hypothetical protein
MTAAVTKNAELPALNRPDEPLGSMSVTTRSTCASPCARWHHVVKSDGPYLTQAKTGQRVYAALMPEMAAELAVMPRAGAQIIVSETTGRPYQIDHFRHEFARIRGLVGLSNDLQFRDLRRTCGGPIGLTGAAGAGDGEKVMSNKGFAPVSGRVRFDTE